MHPKSENYRCFVYLSHGDAGGISTYQAHQIRYLLASNERVVLIDDNPESTLGNKSLNQAGLGYVGVINCSAWSSPRAIGENIELISGYYLKTIILISNPSLLLVCIRSLVRLKFSKNFHIILTLHSKISLSNTFFNILFENVISLIAYIFTSHLIFVSKYTENYWRKFYFIKKINSTVIKNRIIKNLAIKDKTSADNFRVAFVGRLAFDKDPELFCELAKEAYIKGLSYQFNMYGDGPLSKNLKLKYYKYVNFYGWINEDDIYNNIELLIITSPIENAPFALLEAKNYGVPTIAKNIGGIPEMLTDKVDGYLVNNWTSDLVLSLICNIEKNYQTFSLNCINNRSAFDYSISSNAFLKIVNNLSD